jgi:hypothetical protein
MPHTRPTTASDRLPQGDLGLLETEQARQLLASSIPARLAFIALDETPRIVPTWFHWDGSELVMVTYETGPEVGIRHPARRIAALKARPDVVACIDTETFPPTSLTIRGRVEITEVQGIAPEYAAAAHRYLGDDGASAMLTTVDQPGTVQARIALRPSWVGLLDFVGRLPSVQGGVQ